MKHRANVTLPGAITPGRIFIQKQREAPLR